MNILSGGVSGMFSMYQANQSRKIEKELAEEQQYSADLQYWESNQIQSEVLASQADAVSSTGRSQANAVIEQGEVEADLYYKEAKSSFEIAKQNIVLMGVEQIEAMRRLEGENEEVEGKAKAMRGASGIRMEGSAKLYQDAIETENANQERYLNKTWNSKISIANKESKATYDLYMERGNSALKVSEIQASSILEIANIQASALREQSSIYGSGEMPLREDYNYSHGKSKSAAQKLNEETKKTSQAKEQGTYKATSTPKDQNDR